MNPTNVVKETARTFGRYINRKVVDGRFEVPFILSYDSGDENVLTISSEFQGINQWWVLEWQSNSYTERIRYEFKGGCNSTYPVKGLLITGAGVY